MVKCVICCDNNTDYNNKCNQCKKSVCKHCYSQIVFNETYNLNLMITNSNCYDKLLIKYCCPFCQLKTHNKIDIDNLCLKCVMTSNSLYVLKLESKLKKIKSNNRTEMALEDCQFENMVLTDRLEISNDLIDSIRDVVVNARKSKLREDIMKEFNTMYPIL